MTELPCSERAAKEEIMLGKGSDTIVNLLVNCSNLLGKRVRNPPFERINSDIIRTLFIMILKIIYEKNIR